MRAEVVRNHKHARPLINESDMGPINAGIVCVWSVREAVALHAAQRRLGLELFCVTLRCARCVSQPPSVCAQVAVVPPIALRGAGPAAAAFAVRPPRRNRFSMK